MLSPGDELVGWQLRGASQEKWHMLVGGLALFLPGQDQLQRLTGRVDWRDGQT